MKQLMSQNQGRLKVSLPTKHASSAALLLEHQVTLSRKVNAIKSPRISAKNY